MISVDNITGIKVFYIDPERLPCAIISVVLT